MNDDKTFECLVCGDIFSQSSPEASWPKCPECGAEADNIMLADDEFDDLHKDSKTMTDVQPVTVTVPQAYQKAVQKALDGVGFTEKADWSNGSTTVTFVVDTDMSGDQVRDYLWRQFPSINIETF
jgi:predicted  nucleic acid-binding Zn-ribbon protein